MSRSDDSAPALAAALALAAKGRAVFPTEADKRPACAHGFRDASNDPAAIKCTFATSGAVLVAIATVPSGIDVQDGGPAWRPMNRDRLPAPMSTCHAAVRC